MEFSSRTDSFWKTRTCRPKACRPNGTTPFLRAAARQDIPTARPDKTAACQPAESNPAQVSETGYVPCASVREGVLDGGCVGWPWGVTDKRVNATGSGLRIGC